LRYILPSSSSWNSLIIISNLSIFSVTCVRITYVYFALSTWTSVNFSLHHRVQNGSGAHPASYTMGTRVSFPGGKAAGSWSWPLTSI
jgi:hypothetical protein